MREFVMLKEYLNNDIKLSKEQMISIICSIIVISGVFGWIYEVIFYYFNSGMTQVYMRGSNFLPWINIYAYGAFLIIVLTYKKRKHPLQVFLISAISTGILEYFSGYILYEKLGLTRCWSYNEEILNFGNIGGFVCLRSITFFGLSGLFLIYVIIPFLINISQKVNIKVFLIISISVATIFILDELYNLFIHSIFNLPKASTIYKKLGLKYIYFTR